MNGSQWTHISGMLPVVALLFVVQGAATGVTNDIAGTRTPSGDVAWSGEPCADLCAAPSDSAESYRRLCASCHGKRGKGDGAAAAFLNPRPANLTTTEGVGQLSDEELLDVITNGRRTMPAFGSLLQPEELRALAAYVRGLAGG